MATQARTNERKHRIEMYLPKTQKLTAIISTLGKLLVWPGAKGS